ncbi:3-oxoacyl-[acyl-carrier-protein] reductase [Fuerstiella marisgermanici]|uniref:3-oxoacyl-[acyl-carrier-protein] reductase n=1 Tax=Fuerstiella marisgermanici TaxID=1891926 RepID=A0A1P8WEQ8_9PLAN|nr:3-oxoacyl-[acyl-carrier-protein] reductase [Fuerstiella marisgermanici]APZ92542.1 3-oxoacyl-[acyl-carrier-protein] reductase FabG [Fuerstiella marisgermanici]
MSLEGRVALVTGGSRGIGRGIVEALAGDGAKVAFVYNSNSAAADEVVASMKEAGHEVMAIQADVRSKDAADKVIADVVEAWGSIDILVNNAGIIRDGLLAMMDADQWQDVIDTNLTSVFNFCQAATRQMMSQRYGRIINMSSVAADVSNPGQANYAASKGGVEGFTRCIATELARRGITANAVAPGFIETDMTQAVVEAAGKEIKKKIPCRRLGLPSDIANAVLFFAQESSSYVTGQIMKVDGGLTLGGIS